MCQARLDFERCQARLKFWEVPIIIGLWFSMFVFQGFMLREYARWMQWYAWDDARAMQTWLIHDDDTCNDFTVSNNAPMVSDGWNYSFASRFLVERLGDVMLAWFPDTCFKLNGGWCTTWLLFEWIKSMRRKFTFVAHLTQVCWVFEKTYLKISLEIACRNMN